MCGVLVHCTSELFGSDKGLDVDNLKEILMQNTLKVFDINCLVKIIPDTPHQQYMSENEQYPPQTGCASMEAYPSAIGKSYRYSVAVKQVSIIRKLNINLYFSFPG